MDFGLQEIKKLEEIYLNSNLEVRNYIASRVIEIESETSMGLLIN